MSVREHDARRWSILISAATLFLDAGTQPASHHWSTETMNPTQATKLTALIPTKLSLLDIVIARHARNHGNHVSPLVGCYLCLIGFPHEVRELRVAA